MIIIFSGYNQRAVIAFLRYLSLLQVSDYAIIASSIYDPIFMTSYKKKVKYVRKHKELDITEIKYIFSDLNKRERCIIAPTTEALNRFILRYRSELEEIGCVIPIVNMKLYEMISDKSSFYQICKSNNITVPKSLFVGRTFETPYVAKPKKYFSDNGCTYSPYLILDQSEHKSFISRGIESYFEFQEYIEGESYYLLYYIGKSGEIYSYSQRNILQQCGGKSILAAVGADLHHEEVSRKYERLLMNLEYYGMIMIELRKNKQDYYMIEANPRFWGPSQLLVDSGVNLWGEFLLDLGVGGKDHFIKNMNEKAVYYWGGGRDGTEVWLYGGKDIYLDREKEFLQSDIYKREDTIDIYKGERKAYENK